MLEDITSDSLSKILDVGVVGSVCVLLVLVLIWQQKYWIGREEKIATKFTEEVRAEREKSDKARDALIAEARTTADLIATFRALITKHDAAMEQLFRLVRKDSV